MSSFSMVMPDFYYLLPDFIIWWNEQLAQDFMLPDRPIYLLISMDG